MSMKNPLTPAGIEPATFRFVAQYLNHCATAVPRSGFISVQNNGGTWLCIFLVLRYQVGNGKLNYLENSFKHSGMYCALLGTAVAQWLRCCATNRKVAGSIPAAVSGFFIDIKFFRSHYSPGVDSASNRNEYQEYLLGGG